MSTIDLFKQKNQSYNKLAPLYERMRPENLKDIVGQKHILGKDTLLLSAIKNDKIGSIIFWGPPGCGKTTIAKVISKETKAVFESLSAVLGGVQDLRKIVLKAEDQIHLYNKSTIVFIDEIHRFNKAQQDALLPHVENGTIVLIGATTENPSFAIIPALLSRTRIFELKILDEKDILILLEKALKNSDKGIKKLNIKFSKDTLQFISDYSQGDARRALDILEGTANFAAQNKIKEVNIDFLKSSLNSKILIHDKSGEAHYNVVSAFIKSMRGSDPDASIYWMMRMLEAGEDPLFILRRMIIFASEDIGNADSNALKIAISADSAFQRLGMPEGIFPLTQCCLYLSSAPKSNSIYKAWTKAKEDVKNYGTLPVPLKLRNAVTSAMKEWGYGKNYRYPHDEGGYSKGETYLPDKLLNKKYYFPSTSGDEVKIKKNIDNLNK